MYNNTHEVKCMMNKMIKYNLIDMEGLFLLNYKDLNLSEQEAIVILLTLRLEKNNTPYISPKLLSNYMSIDEKAIDRLIIALMNKQLLAFENNSISTKPLFSAIFKTESAQENKEKEPKKINLVKCFEEEFKRALTPIEIETLKEWKQCQYSDEMILDALKEATLSNVHNMRYIDKILIDWAKYGRKSSGRQTVDTKQNTIDLIQYEWWNE